MVRRLAHSPGHGARVAIVCCSKKGPGGPTSCAAPCLLGASGKNEVRGTPTVNTGINRILIGKHSWKNPNFLQNSWKKDELYYIIISYTASADALVWEPCCSHAGVSDGMKVVLYGHQQLSGWLWPAHLSLCCSCFPLGTPWALCDVCLWVHPILPAGSPMAPCSLSCKFSTASLGFYPPASSFQQCPPRG